MTLQQDIVSRACIFIDDKILVVKRGDEGTADDRYWELPGGRVEPGEHPEKTVVREIKEELSLNIKPVKVSWVSSVIYPKAAPTNQAISIDYIVELMNINDINNIRLTHEHSDWKLITKDQIQEPQPLRELMSESLKQGFLNR